MHHSYEAMKFRHWKIRFYASHRILARQNLAVKLHQRTYISWKGSVQARLDNTNATKRLVALRHADPSSL